MQIPDQINKKALKWKSRRGLKELDILLERFFECQYDSISNIQRKQLEELLEMADLDFMDLLLNSNKVKEHKYKDVLVLLSNQKP